MYICIYAKHTRSIYIYTSMCVTQSKIFDNWYYLHIVCDVTLMGQ